MTVTLNKPPDPEKILAVLLELYGEQYGVVATAELVWKDAG